jgi:hypothetical protein
MYRQPFLFVPSMPTTTVGNGITWSSIDRRPIDSARFTL